MITFERSTDYELLGRLLRNPKLYPWISDDFSPPLDQVAAIENPDFWHILARDGEELLGFYRLAPQNAICWELHTVMPLDARALAAMPELFRWIWDRTIAVRIVTNVPSFNRVALRFGLRAGFKQYGLNEKSYRKQGKDHDQILLGISRP